MQQATGDTAKLAGANPACTGGQARQDAADKPIELQVVKRLEAKKGLGLLRQRWVVERSFGAF